MISGFLKKYFGKFWSYLVKFYKEEFDWKYLLFLIVFLGASIYWAYSPNAHGEPNFIRFRYTYLRRWGSFTFYVVQYAVPFLVAYLSYIFFKGKFKLLTDIRFWLLFAFAVSMFAFRGALQWKVNDVVGKLVFETYPNFWKRLIFDIARMLAVMIPITIYWLFDRKSSETPYGFTVKNFDLRPYFLILGVMLPFVIGFGLTDHFGGYYPRGLKNLDYYFGNGVKPPQGHLLLYELIYGLDFVSIEYFFRGFLIIAFIRFAGPGVILPMASFYVFIHFGKPMIETISSFFGGAILGVLSYYSRSIWGGIVVHMGIAWLMELGAYLGSF
ncbi:MAG: CPBP family intramembrane metalloprotease [Flavobacteriales bacterium]|nr:CPBP family intramembrane metalloprotease [Flavobacteriales bacterium]